MIHVMKKVGSVYKCPHCGHTEAADGAVLHVGDPWSEHKRPIHENRLEVFAEFFEELEES